MTILRFTSTFLLMLFAVAALATTGNDRAIESMLRQQANAWDVAIVTKNRIDIEANIAAGFMQIGSDGAKADKAQFVAALLDERLSIEPYTVEDFQVRVYADVALVTGTTQMQGSWDGKPFSSHYRFTDVYVREHGKWRVVNVQTTPIQ